MGGMQKWLPRLGLLARLAVGGVLLWAGGVKLPAIQESVTAVRAYQLLDPDLAAIVGYALPIVEVVVGLLLVVGLFTRWSAVVSGLLMVVFIAGIASVWSRGIAIDCGCFGDGGQIPWEEARAAYPWEIARDVALLAASALLVWRPRTPYAVDTLLFPDGDAHDENEEEEEHDVEVRS